MAKTACRREPTLTHDLQPLRTDCPHCGHLMWADYANRRTIATLDGLTRLNLTIRRCRNPDCPAYHRPYRPEGEGRVAFRYCSPAGALTEEDNVNGSARCVAGVFNETRTVLGLMPHPENSTDPLLGCTDGQGLFDGLVGARR